MTTQELRSIAEKKIVRWAQGLVVFVTPEAKAFGWDDKTAVKVIALSDSEGDAIVIRKVKKNREK